MNRFDINDISGHSYCGGTITAIRSDMINGDFPEEETQASGLVSFHIRFQFDRGKETDALRELKEVKCAVIISFKAVECEDGYEIELVLCVEKLHSVKLRCKNIYSELYRYKGMSYRNIFDEINFAVISDIVPDEQWNENKEIINVDDDLKLIHFMYIDRRFDSQGKAVSSHAFGKYSVQKDGLEIYSFLNYDDLTIKEPLIHHSNGQRFLAFHVDLYGISYLDPCSGEVYNFVPEGAEHDYRLRCGESFIITSVHYDAASDLVAYDGCWWAGDDEVYVGDLIDPLHFDPHMLRLHDQLDPEWEEISSIVFVRWAPDALVVNCDGKETEIPIDVIRKKLFEMDKSEITDL